MILPKKSEIYFSITLNQANINIFNDHQQFKVN